MHDRGLRTGLCGSVGRLEHGFLSLETSEADAVWILERPQARLAAAQFTMPASLGKGSLRALRLGSDLFVVVANVRYRDQVSIPVVGEDLIEFHFRFSGSLHLPDGRQGLSVSGGDLLIWRQPVGVDLVERLSGEGGAESSVTIYCRPSFLERWFGDVSQLVDARVAEALRGPNESVRSLVATMYPRLSKLVLDLACMRGFEGVALARAESLVVQIVAEILTGISVRGTERGDARLSGRDVECLRAARTYLVARHAPPPTIAELGRHVGLSPTKLKTGFRLLFGRTVSDFANEQRMISAKDLLRMSDRPIAEVAAALGYQFQNSFTVAFRRQFGVLPKDYRRDPTAYDEELAA